MSLSVKKSSSQRDPIREDLNKIRSKTLRTNTKPCCSKQDSRAHDVITKAPSRLSYPNHPAVTSPMHGHLNSEPSSSVPHFWHSLSWNFIETWALFSQLVIQVPRELHEGTPTSLQCVTHLDYLPQAPHHAFLLS